MSGRGGRGASGLDGYLLLDKPAGLTSHDVVATVRRALGERRVGHAGTLDPDATGLLVLGVGRSTRLLTFVGGAEKVYEGELVLGASTDTLDASGTVLERFAMDGVTAEDLADAAAAFVGEIDQVPPMVSAVHVGGRRLYELAREGVEVDRPARRVRVTRFEVSPLPEPLAYRFVVACSSGTYVRALVADLGASLGGGAYLRRLRRTELGRFTVAEAVPLEAVAAKHLRPPTGLVEHLPRVACDAGLAGRVLHGAVLEASELGLSDPPAAVALVDGGGGLLAVYGAHRGTSLKPLVVHARPTGEDGEGR